MSIFTDVSHEEQWISISDLMSALMMIFLLLSLFYMISIIDHDKADEASVYQRLVGEKEDLLKEKSKLQEKVDQVVSQSLVIQKRSNKLMEAERLLNELKGENITLPEIPTIVKRHTRLIDELKGQNVTVPEIPTIIKEHTQLLDDLKGKNTEIAEIPTIVSEHKKLRDELKGRSISPTEIAAIVTEHTELADKLKGEKIDVKQIPTVISEYKTIKELMAEKSTSVVSLVERQVKLEEQLETEQKKVAGMADTHKFLQELSLESETKPDIPALVAYTRMLRELRGVNVKTPEIPAIVVEHTKMLQELKGSDVKPPEIPSIVSDYRKLRDELKGESLTPVEIAAIVTEHKKLREELKTQDVKVSQLPRIVSEYKILEKTQSRKSANIVAALRQKNQELQNTLSQAVIYEDVIKELQQSLLVEFDADLKKWNAELRDGLTLRFNEPEVLFAAGKAELTTRFRNILNNFFPRYLKVITGKQFRNDIVEVRIEGHTSSDWIGLHPKSKDAYFNNMILSQKRARNTLFYVLDNIPAARKNYTWLRSRLTANGLSSSKLVDKNGVLLTDKDSTGREDRRLSRRVEFRVKIDAESKISKIIGKSSVKNKKQ